MSWIKALEILGFLVGLIYLWWEYHADWRLWYASIAMPLISMCLYFNKGIYADFAINIYYLIISIYGYIVWTRGGGHKPSPSGTKSSEAGADISEVSHSGDANGSDGREAKPLAIRNLPIALLIRCFLVFLVLWGSLYLILANLTDSTVPIPDAFTTALSIVGMWLLSRKYIQQWFAWMAVDAVCIGLYAYKGLPLYSLLYAAYTIIAIFGYLKWRRLMSKK